LLAQKYARLSLAYANAMGFPAYLAALRVYAGCTELEYGSPTRALELALEALDFRLKSTYARARTSLLEIGEVLPERWVDFLETPIGKSA
jgi:hypothetical protein